MVGIDQEERPVQQDFTLTQPTRFDRKDNFDNDKEDLSKSQHMPPILIIVLRAKQTTLTCDISFSLLFIVRKVRREFEHKHHLVASTHKYNTCRIHAIISGFFLFSSLWT